MARRSMALKRPRRDDAGVVASHTHSRMMTTYRDAQPGSTTLPGLATPTSSVQTSSSASRSVADTSTTAAVNVAPPPTSTSSYYDIFPALASLESALRPQPATNPGSLQSVTNALSNLGLVSLPATATATLTTRPTTTTLHQSTSMTLAATTSTRRSTATSSAAASAPEQVHSSVLAALVTGGVVVAFVGVLAVWHAFRRARRRWAAPTPIFGGTTPHSFRSTDGRAWEKFEEVEGDVGPSASAANDLAHRPAPTHAQNELRGMIGRPMMMGLGYEPHSYSIYMPTKPAPAPPVPTITVASASHTDLYAAGNFASMGPDSSRTLVHQPSLRTPGPVTPARVLERKLSERQTKVLTRALGLGSPPSPSGGPPIDVDLDLYRYTRYGLDEAQSEYVTSPPAPMDGTSLGQLMLECPPTPAAALTPIPEQMNVATAASSPGLAYLASTWTVSEPTAPLKVQRKDTPRHVQGPATRKKRASLLPKLDFPLPPAIVPPSSRNDWWDEVAAR